MFDILYYPFIQNAFLAGTLVAIVAAVVGYFLLLRSLTFAGHALSHVGFAGAAGAVLVGVNPIWGLLAFTISAGVGIGLLGKELRQRDIAIGIIMTFALSLGILFLWLYQGFAERAFSILFGTIVGISRADVITTALLCALLLLVLVAFFRPLLFSSVDAEVAEARGVPVALLNVFFLVLVAITVSISVQIVGVLLIFTLLVGPAATAMRIARSPIRAVGLAILLGLCYTWIGIFLAANGSWPISFYIATLSFMVYLPVRLTSSYWQRGRRRREPAAHFTTQQVVQDEHQEETTLLHGQMV